MIARRGYGWCESCQTTFDRAWLHRVPFKHWGHKLAVVRRGYVARVDPSVRAAYRGTRLGRRMR